MVIADNKGISYLNNEAKRVLSIRNVGTDKKEDSKSCKDDSSFSQSSEVGKDNEFDEDSNMAISDMICFDSVEQTIISPI